MLKKFFAASLLLLCLTVLGFSHAKATNAELTVFAAASTTNALTEIANLYETAGHGKIALSFGSSSTLAKQIENGAPADIFLSANTQWMDYLENKKMLLKGSRKDMLENSIVIIVPTQSPIKSIDISSKLDILALLGKEGLISVGDPAHVPVGTYAKAALEYLELWEKVKDRLAPAKDVRAGLAMVERGEVPLGIVYASDAVISSKIRVVGTFPQQSHPAIFYPVAAMHTKNSSVAQSFVDFLGSAEAKLIWKKYGFEVK